jgi:hypothetical protein
MHPAGDADAAGVGQAFETGSQIHPVTKDVAILDNDVTLMDADAKFDAPFGGDIAVAFPHRALYLDRTTHGIDDAGEFDQHPVAGGLYDAPTMFGNFRIAEFAPDRPQQGESALLVSLHQPRIPGNISRQYRGKPPFDARLSCGVHAASLWRMMLHEVAAGTHQAVHPGSRFQSEFAQHLTLLKPG